MEENLFMAEHMAKNYDTAEASAFLLPSGKHRVSPLHPLDLLCKALASAHGCTVIKWSLVKRDKQPDSKALECARLILGEIVVVTTKLILS